MSVCLSEDSFTQSLRLRLLLYPQQQSPTVRNLATRTPGRSLPPQHHHLSEPPVAREPREATAGTDCQKPGHADPRALPPTTTPSPQRATRGPGAQRGHSRH
ncbi:hypothetical protein NDU88_000487 [Pleurodeles waltl]|uniref:Uncharacterized protein n=1 Tax=Pleurodeles waltl TaxID=8319 RepID=A0AAV7MJ12_PLEWA|nr:hypothetical protein NDU88_000487 [Pleurodeles waltl]